jgi:hypothetical protein
MLAVVDAKDWTSNKGPQERIWTTRKEWPGDSGMMERNKTVTGSLFISLHRPNLFLNFSHRRSEICEPPWI